MTSEPDFTEVARKILEIARNGREDHALIMIQSHLGIAYWTGRDDLARENLALLGKQTDVRSTQ